MKLVRPDADPVRDKFAQARKELAAALIEWDEGFDFVLTALVANEHVLLVGPPGCGKSLLLDSVLAWTGGTKFSILLTKFTTVEEVMGPVSLTALKEDKYVRVAAARLDLDEYTFGPATPAYRCPHCGAVLDRVTPLVAFGPGWHWALNHAWLAGRLRRAELYDAEHPRPEGRSS